jgi:hypothetical protein
MSASFGADGSWFHYYEPGSEDFLKEEISSVRWARICLIVLGAGLVTWSAKQKEKEPAEQSPASTDYGLR